MWSSFVGILSSLIQLFYGFTHSMGAPSYGLAVILFTVVLRLLMFPLNFQQAKSMKSMSLLQPRLKKLQEQYKKSPDILNRETQAMYKKYGINPLSGCLPMLIQMPIMIALFQAMRNFQYVGEGVSFFWLPNLMDPDPLPVLPILVGVSSFLQTKISQAAQPQANEQTQMMNTMTLYVMPVMLGWMSRTFPSGLALYWSTFNILGVVMQVVINASVNRVHKNMQESMDADDALTASTNKENKATKPKKISEKKNPPEKKKDPVKTRARKKDEDNKGKALDFD